MLLLVNDTPRENPHPTLKTPTNEALQLAMSHTDVVEGDHIFTHSYIYRDLQIERNAVTGSTIKSVVSPIASGEPLEPERVEKGGITMTLKSHTDRNVLNRAETVHWSIIHG